jgi:hypothetical protein
MISWLGREWTSIPKTAFNPMKKIILLSLIYTGFLVTIPVRVNALKPQTVSQNFHGEPNLRLAQFRRHHDARSVRVREASAVPTAGLTPTAEKLRQRQYSVYYRSPGDLQWIRWTLEGLHADRRDAERAARRLERRGYRTDIRVNEAANRPGGWSGGWGRNRQ